VWVVRRFCAWLAARRIKVHIEPISDMKVASRPAASAWGGGCRSSVEAILLRAKKAEVVDGLRGVFSDAGVVVVAHYKGLSVAEVSELRRGMREAGAAFRVTKNTLAKIALAETPYASLEGLFSGPTAIAWSADPIAAPKAAVGFAKRNDKLAIVGGALPGNLLTPDQVRALAELPGIDELRARLVGLLTTPAARLIGVLQAPGAQVARVLAAHAEQS
jgi:large subunit ribosomal protein L10